MQLSTENLTKIYEGTPALDQVSVQLEPGQVVAVIGANGAGKTTLLRVLSTIAAPTEGQVRMDGEELTRDRMDLRRRFFFLPDFPLVHEHWSIIKHLGMVLKAYEREETDSGRMIEVLEALDLLPIANSPFAVLSRGQRYKGVLAALLLVQPELWLLDEPFASGMDPLGINYFKETALKAAKAGATILYSTQIVEIAERFSDRYCLLHQGKVAAFARTSSLPAPDQDGFSGLEHLLRQLREGAGR